MKKLFALLLVLLVAFACVGCGKQPAADTPASAAPPAAAVPDSTEPETLMCGRYTVNGEELIQPLFSYELLADRTARITGYYGYLYEVDIPESVDGHPVSTIGKHAIPNVMGSIVTIRIPDCVTCIEPDAFENIYTLVQFTVSETHPVFQVVDGALVSPAEKRIIRGRIQGDYRIPDGIERIDSHAFWGSACKSIYIPESVTKLGRNPFAMCNGNNDDAASLRDVILSPDNPALEIRDGVLFSREDHRLVWCFDIFHMTSLDYSIPDDIEMIDDCAFWRWNMLESVTIPAGVKEMGINPFYRRRTKAEIRLDRNNEAFTIQDGLLISRVDRRVIDTMPAGEDSLSVPEGIETIGDYAFCHPFIYVDSELILPDSVTRIGAYAFAGCNGIRSIRIPAGVREIGCRAFYDCQKIADIPVFGDGIQIDAFAFSQCFNIQSLTIDGRAQIGFAAFSSCGLQEVRIGKGSSVIMGNAFSSCRRLETADLGEGLSFLGGGAFRGCAALKTISLPDSLAYIGDLALANEETMEYNKEYDLYYPVYSTTAEIIVSDHSYAAQYCEKNGIGYTVR